MTSEDVKILRGSPETRRRDVDMFISGIDPEYFDALRRYHSALGHRNALLRAEETAGELYSPFEIQMARAAETVSQKRRERLTQMAQIAGRAVRAARARKRGGRGNRDEALVGGGGLRRFPAKCSRGSAPETSRGARPRRGPHRDDFPVRIGGLDAKTYASEGQQRSAALAIKLAQFEIFKAEKGIEPAILCDDILGELDAARRAAFWECVPPLGAGHIHRHFRRARLRRAEIMENRAGRKRQILFLKCKTSPESSKAPSGKSSRKPPTGAQ